MKKILGLAGAIALSIIPTPGFSGEVEQKEMMSVTEQLLPQIGEKYKNLNKKEKKVEKLKPTGVGEGVGELRPIQNPFRTEPEPISIDEGFRDEDPFKLRWMRAF